MKGRPPKPAERRQRRNHPHSIALRVEERVHPSAPEGLLRVVRERWEAYWASGLSHATSGVHIPVVERLFLLYDERERSYRAVRKHGRIIEGSQGQFVQSPLLRYIATCDAEIRQLEDRLGLSPRSIAQLGSTFATAQRSLDDLNRDVQAEIEDNDSDTDPRLEVVS